MGEKLIIKSQSVSIEADLSDALVILSEPIDQNTITKGLNIKISEESKQYDVMGYTTDLDTMRLIFQNRTFRSSSLSNENLNDKMEQQRVGVSEFAGSRFITCFTHMHQESGYFWRRYGKDVWEEKVLLQFRNFAINFTECIRTDFAKVKNDKLCFFSSPEYGAVINNQRFSDNSQYDLRAYINSIGVFDVEYVPPDSTVFSEDNSGQVDIDFSHVAGQKQSVVKMQGFNPTVLGKHKTNSWEREKETRILCTLSNPMFKGWDYVDLQLHSEIFRGLQIILSPWDDGTLREKVEGVILSSDLPADIASSITIKDSELKGTLNFQ